MTTVVWHGLVEINITFPENDLSRWPEYVAPKLIAYCLASTDVHGAK